MRFRLSTMSVTSSTTPGQSGELMLCTGDLDRGDGSAFERREQDAAERISDRVAVTRFKGLGDEPRVGFSGRAFLFDEGLRHFKTTVIELAYIDFGFRIADCGEILFFPDIRFPLSDIS